MRLLFIVIIFTAARTVIAGTDHTSPYIWLEQMSRALQHHHYQGDFSYRYGDAEQQLRVIHGSDSAGMAFERVMDLSGSQQEVVQQQGVLYCRLQERFSLPQAATGSPASQWGAAIRQRLEESYTFTVQGGDGVAGYPTRRIDVQPRDQLRYGYRFWIAESEPHLLLQFEMVDTSGAVLEQMKFTALEILGLPLQPPLPVDSSSHMSRAAAADVQRSSHWRVVMLPPGFRIEEVQILEGLADGVTLEHHIFSDGFSSISLFIEPHKGVMAPMELRHGAVSMASLTRDATKITVVGEVPLATVRVIASAVEPLHPSNQ